MVQIPFLGRKWYSTMPQTGHFWWPFDFFLDLIFRLQRLLCNLVARVLKIFIFLWKRQNGSSFWRPHPFGECGSLFFRSHSRNYRPLTEIKERCPVEKFRQRQDSQRVYPKEWRTFLRCLNRVQIYISNWTKLNKTREYAKLSRPQHKNFVSDFFTKKLR